MPIVLKTIDLDSFIQLPAIINSTTQETLDINPIEETLETPNANTVSNDSLGKEETLVLEENTTTKSTPITELPVSKN
jgi:hypothetical protein